jgi:glycosyltransferase involved in cell wall biosynthesis
MTDISVTVLTKNSQRYMRKCLEALKDFAEVIVLDNGSIDDTIHIASAFPNVKIHKCEFMGFGRLKNLAAEFAAHDWILNIDSDEIMPPELVEEIRSLDLVDDNIYAFSRKNFYNNKLVKCCGWHPDHVLRLYNKRGTSFSQKLVHEALLVDNPFKVVHLHHAIEHYPFHSATDLIDKMQHYSSLFAKENRGKKSSSPTKAVSRGLFTFVKHYLLQRGCLCGYEGLLISISNAYSVFFKYILLYEENKKT